MGSCLTEVATRLVAFDTVSERSNMALIEYLADPLEGHGLRVAVQRFEIAGVEKANLVASVGPARPGGLAIAGHVDVVPHASQPGWTHDPLRLEISGDRVYGRGTSDMKVFLAQCLDAAALLDRRSLRRPLSFLFTADEEIGSAGAALLAPQLADLLENTPRRSRSPPFHPRSCRRSGWCMGLREVQMTEPSVVRALSSPTGTVLERALFRVLGGTRSMGAPFATDGPRLAQQGIGTLICGPGELDQAHQPNESIGRDAFENGANVILAVAGALCGSARA